MNQLILRLSILLAFSFISMGCEPVPDKDLSEDSQQDALSEGMKVTVKQDATDVDSFKVYTYQFIDDPAEPLADIPSVEKPAVSPADVVEKTIQPAKEGGAHRPPLFSRDCLTREDPEQCSDYYLSAYVEDYVKKKKFDTPVPVVKMYVSFVLDNKGQPMLETVQMEPQNAECESCETLAMTIVEDMPGWIPGMVDGNLKQSVIRFPIFFEE